jgi:hypothetical protein
MVPWFNCAICLVNYYDGMRSVVTQFDSESCIAIKKCPENFADGIFKANFEIIRHSIKQLEDPKLSLNKSINIVNNIQEQIGAIKKLVGKKIKDKLEDILTKNKEFTNSYFYIKCVKRVFFVHEKVFYAETKVEVV